MKKRIDLIEKTHTSGGKFSSLDSRNEDIKIILGIKKASINSILNTEKNFEDINELKDQYENDIYEKLKDKTGEALIRDTPVQLTRQIVKKPQFVFVWQSFWRGFFVNP